jgi:diguanylate cyclase (GGDEF)-like protein
MHKAQQSILERDEPLAAVEAALAVDPVVSLLQIDIDRFGELNDAAGRDVGDRVLGATVALLRDTAKTEQWTYLRLGGDEFGLVAPSVGLEQAFLRADRLRLDLDKTFRNEHAGEPRCTASIGVANVPRDAKSADELLRKADLALFSAKDQGGDAVGLTPGDEMVLKSSYYGSAQLARLKSLAEREKKKEAVLLREALDDLLRRYDRS